MAIPLLHAGGKSFHDNGSFRRYACKTDGKRQTSILILAIVCIMACTYIPWARRSDHFAAIHTSPVCTGPDAIACKIDAAHARFTTFQATQSQTVGQAMRRYKQKYRRNPPPGMRQWFAYALKHNSKVIDNFDQIENDLKPFRQRKIEAIQNQRRLANAKLSAPGEMLGVLNIIDGKALVFGPSTGPMSSITLESILEPVAKDIPDLSILYNWYAEPRILGTNPVATKKLNEATQQSDAVKFDDLSGNYTFSTLKKACPRNTFLSSQIGPVINDFCGEAERDADLSETHGFFQAPDQFHPTEQLLPILSRGKLSVFNDILAPNVCYHHKSYRSWEINDTIPFEQKTKDLYWRGTTTGISMTSENWAKGHRHRLVRYMSQLRKASQAFREGKKDLEHDKGAANMKAGGNMLKGFEGLQGDVDVVRALTNLKPEVWNVGFSKTTKTCPQEVCETILQELPLYSFDKAKMSTQHQFVFDADGQSMSCRYYYLLGTNSVIFKQTLWGEWHDERLFPWLHYIPAGLDLDKNEIPIIMDWFINSKKGQEYARMIADHSRQWAETSLRQIDITLYFYRLLLEYADLFAY